MSFLYILIAAVAYIADRVTKAWAAGALRSEHGGCLPLIDGVFYFTYCENRGAAFSMMWGQTWLLVSVTSLICIAGIYLLFFGRRRLPVFPSVCIAMAVGGALGNLYDRALLGYVIDMLDFRLINFAVFNVADSFICVGIILLGVWWIFYAEKALPTLPFRWGAPKSPEATTGEQNHAHDPKQGDN